MIALQAAVDFFAEPDPIEMVLVGVVFVALIVLGIIGSKVNTKRIDRRSAATSSPRFSRLSFRRAARRAGLDRRQIGVLERVARQQSLADPARMFSSRHFLDRTIAKAVRMLDAEEIGEAEREERKYELLSVRRSLDQVQTGNVDRFERSGQLRSGTRLTLITEDKSQYECKLLANSDSFLAVEAPTTYGGETLVWDKSTPLKVTFRADDGTLYGFRSSVLGYRKQRAQHQLFIAHSDKIRSVQKRKSPRREFRRSAYFFPVRVVQSGSGRSAKRQAVVDANRRDLGNIEDISAGGCALRARTALKKGGLIKISFEIERGRPVTAFGKVRGTDRGYHGSLMHIMFTRVSRDQMNRILSYVYGYTDE